jgi:hypothetical protein
MIHGVSILSWRLSELDLSQSAQFICQIPARMSRRRRTQREETVTATLYASPRLYCSETCRPLSSVELAVIDPSKDALVLFAPRCFWLAFVSVPPCAIDYNSDDEDHYQRWSNSGHGEPPVSHRTSTCDTLSLHRRPVNLNSLGEYDVSDSIRLESRPSIFAPQRLMTERFILLQMVNTE